MAMAILITGYSKTNGFNTSNKAEIVYDRCSLLFSSQDLKPIEVKF